MKFSMDLEGKLVRFDVTKRKRQKRIYIKPYKRHHYRVSAPPYASKRAIEAMAYKFKDEILSFPALISPFERLLRGDTVKIFDEEIPVVTHQAQRRKVELSDKVLHLFTPQDDVRLDKKAVQRRLKHYYLQEVRNLHHAMRQAYPHLIEESVEFSCRYMKSKYGSAQPTTKKITLNLALVHYPFLYTRYIYAHEMMHFLHPNHSCAFYDALSVICPDHERLRKALDSHHKAYTTLEVRDKNDAV